MKKPYIYHYHAFWWSLDCRHDLDGIITSEAPILTAKDYSVLKAVLVDFPGGPPAKKLVITSLTPLPQAG